MGEGENYGGTDPTGRLVDETLLDERPEPFRPVVELPELDAIEAASSGLLGTDDWAQWRHNAAHTGFSRDVGLVVEAGEPPVEVWRTKIGPDDASRTTDAGIRASVVAAAGAVYAPSLDGFLAKLDAATGRKLWETSLPRWIFGTPAVATMTDGRRFVFVTTTFGGFSGIHALEDVSGRVAWRFELQRGSYNNAATVVGNIVYAADGGGNVYAFDGTRFSPGSSSNTPGTNTPVWTATPATQSPPTPGWPPATPRPFRGGPTVVGDLLYVADEAGTLYARRVRDGAHVWKFHAGPCARCSNTPVVSGGAVYYAADYGPFTAGVVFALDTLTGALNWISGVPDRIYGMPYYQSSLAAGYDSIYVPAPSSLWALDPRTGRVKWRSSRLIKEGRVWFLTSPAVADNRISAGLFSSPADVAPAGGYAVFDALTGAVLVAPVNLATVYNSPAVSNGRLFMGFHNLPPGYAVAFRSKLSSGAPVA
jgi:outer membrane protein assembly factor BamB